jgi:hypothetical protein
MITDVKIIRDAKLVQSRKSKNTSEYNEFSFLTDYNTQPVESNEILIHPRLQLVSRVTTKGKIKFCNTDYVTVTGRSEKEVLKNKVTITTHPQMPKTIFNYVISELSKGNEIIAVVNHLDKYGNSYWLNTHFKPNYTSKLSLAYTTKSKPSSRETIQKIKKIYNTLYRIENRKSNFLVENEANKEIANKYFNGLIEMEYGNYEGFVIHAFE